MTKPMQPYVVGFIFARGGSKGVPRKNIRPLGGRPLIARAIEVARRSSLIQRIVVSTDNAEIAQVARECGAEVPFLRPAALAQDDSPEWLAWRHAIQELEVLDGGRKLDVFVCIPTTSPMRAVEDVDNCVRTLLETDADLVLTVKQAERSPYFNMVVLEGDNARLVIPPTTAIHTRQAAPAVYDVTTVAYAARPDYVLRATALFAGKVKAVVVPRERALDIDTELDFQFAEFLLARRLLAENPE